MRCHVLQPPEFGLIVGGQPVTGGVVFEPPPPEPVRDGKIAAVREYTDTQHAAHVLFGKP